MWFGVVQRDETERWTDLCNVYASRHSYKHVDAWMDGLIDGWMNEWRSGLTSVGI